MPQASSRAYNRDGRRIPRQFTRVHNWSARRTPKRSSKHLSERDADKPVLLAAAGSSLSPILDHHDAADDSWRVSSHTVDAALSHSDDPSQLFDIGLSLLSHFENLGRPDDLERAIAAFQNAIELTSDDDTVNMSRILQWLGNSLRTRFQHLGKLDDLERAIMINQKAVDIMPEGHPEMTSRLHGLGASLGTRFQHIGELADLERAIALFRNAINLTPIGHPDKAGLLVNFGIALGTRFKHVGGLSNLNEAIANFRHTNELTPEGHSDKPLQLAALGASLGFRFQHLGEPDDLERAIENLQHAVKLTPEGHPDKPQRLASLGVTLLDRFRHLGELDDLELAIASHQGAVKLTPEGHPNKPLRLAELGVALLDRFQHLGELDDLERAIGNLQCAVKLTPEGHPNKPLRLAQLGAALSDRFLHLGELDDLESAIENYQQAVKFTPEGHSDKPRRLADLGISLGHRFKHLGELDDLQCAISNQQHAVQLTPEGHPDRVEQLWRLGSWLKLRFEREPSQSHFDAAVDHFIEANAQSLGKPSIRLNSARECAFFLYSYPAFSSAELLLRAHSYVMGVLPEIVWIGHSIGRRYQETAQLTEAVSTAVAVAIHCEKLSRAIEWLEAGRSLIWSQIISLRLPFSDLKEQHPNLAADLKEVSQRLQRLGHLPQLSTSLDSDEAEPYVPSHDMADSHRRLAIRYDNTLRDIRRCSCFEDFLRPPRFSGLLPLLEHLDGPVVFINVHPHICDAVALCPDGTLARVKLPDLTAKRASKLRYLWMQYLERCHTRVRRTMMSDMIPARGSANMFGKILARLWTWIVEPILQHLNLITSQLDSARLPHITWCPTGPLTQLPLHAAGIYDAKQHHRPHVFDFVVSSYTPSLSALLRCTQGSSHRSSQPDMLVVAQPATPGLSLLPGTQKECARIRAVIPEVAYTLLEHEQAVVEKTAAVIDQYPWVHFACHGVQDATDPTQSAFVLYDGRLTLSMLMSTVADNAELAFLSACQTAVGDEKIPEESAHLAAGMLVVGFKGVIATMWSIGDEDAPIVAEAYYKKLLELRSSGAVGRGQTGAAYALHEAVKVLREKVGEQNFVKWAPFVHFGV